MAAARSKRLIQVATSLQGDAPPCTTGSIKDEPQGHRDSSSSFLLVIPARHSCWSFLLGFLLVIPARRSCLSHSSLDSAFSTHPTAVGTPPTHMLTPPFFSASSLAAPTNLFLSATLPTCSRLRLLHPLTSGSTQSPSLTPDDRVPSLDSQARDDVPAVKEGSSSGSSLKT